GGGSGRAEQGSAGEAQPGAGLDRAGGPGSKAVRLDALIGLRLERAAHRVDRDRAQLVRDALRYEWGVAGAQGVVAEPLRIRPRRRLGAAPAQDRAKLVDVRIRPAELRTQRACLR